MIGKLDPAQKKVRVIGAGFAGLVAAYELDRRGYEVTLFEEKARAGGIIRTENGAWGISESAAHSLLATPAVRDLCKEIGVSLIPVRPGSRARFIWRGGKMRRFPLSFREALLAFFRAYYQLAPRDRKSGELTMEEWGQRFLGKAATRYLIGPFVAGIYGTRPRDLRSGVAFPSLVVPRGQSLVSYFLVHRLLRRFFREIRGVGRSKKSSPKPQMMAPEHGMGSLTEHLAARLEKRLGSRFRLGERVSKLEDHPSNTILAVPALEAAGLLEAHDPGLASALLEVQYTPLVSITVFALKRDLARPPRGVGVLIPESEKKSALGVLFNSSAFSGRVRPSEEKACKQTLKEMKGSHERVSLTFMLGGSFHPEMVDADCFSDERLKEIVRADLESIFGLKRGAVLRR